MRPVTTVPLDAITEPIPAPPPAPRPARGHRRQTSRWSLTFIHLAFAVAVGELLLTLWLRSGTHFTWAQFLGSWHP